MPTLFLFSTNIHSVETFLKNFYKDKPLPNVSIFENYKISFENPIEMSDILSAIIDNNDKYNISAWLNLDNDLYFKVTQYNLNDIIKYLFERYPY